LLCQQKGDWITFDELIDAELTARAVNGGDGGRVALAGPTGVQLPSGTVEMLSMALHELTTNAVKYGALKQSDGRLTIRWRQETSQETGEPWLHIDWKESDAEMPTSVGGTGQGRKLIEQALPYQFDARTTFALEADGVHCTISLPVASNSDPRFSGHAGGNVDPMRLADHALAARRVFLWSPVGQQLSPSLPVAEAVH
jgi:two-component system CheB/CheR fusion protein